MKRIFIFAVLFLLTAGCINDIPMQPDSQTEVLDQTTIRAGFEEPDTKSRISMMSDGKYAKVLWTRGDAIAVIDASNSSYYPSKQFTTDEDGVSNAAFTNPSYTPASDVTRRIGFYPFDELKWDGNYLGIWIPSQQTATPNSVAEGLNKAYAYTTDINSNGLTFKNIPALVKFSLTGENVSSLKSIRFVASSIIAGDGILQDIDKEEPTFNMDSYFLPRRDVPSYTIELTSSSFSEHTDYYIAMIPGETKGFSMVFSNSDGDYVVLDSDKTLTLPRSNIIDMGTIDIGNSYGDGAVTQYMTATKGKKPVDIVVISDGFTDTQKGTFSEEGSFMNLAKSGIDFLFDTEPYKTYRDYFNVYFIWKASAEAGASVTDGNGVITQKHNTAFGSRWGESSYNDMSADEGKVYSFVSSHCPSIVKGEKTIDEVAILLLVNDTRYGGKCFSASSGRSYCIVPSLTRGGR